MWQNCYLPTSHVMLLTAMPTNMMMEEHHIHSALSLSVRQVREECPLSAFTLPPECIGCKPEMQMMYAGSKLGVVKDCGFTKVNSIPFTLTVSGRTELWWLQVFELRSAEDLTEDWLKTKLDFFR